jgi:hypothetical protein
MGTGGTAVLRFRNALPNATAALVVSGSFNPVPRFGGILVPGLPPVRVIVAPTDGEGRIDRAFSGGGGPRDVYVQYLVDDPGAAGGVAFSNAIKAIFQP